MYLDFVDDVFLEEPPLEEERIQLFFEFVKENEPDSISSAKAEDTNHDV